MLVWKSAGCTSSDSDTPTGEITCSLRSKNSGGLPVGSASSVGTTMSNAARTPRIETPTKPSAMIFIILDDILLMPVRAAPSYGVGDMLRCGRGQGSARRHVIRSPTLYTVTLKTRYIVRFIRERSYLLYKQKS